MGVELIESDDDNVDMESSKMTLVKCRESLEGIANFIAQDACLGDEDLRSSSLKDRLGCIVRVHVSTEEFVALLAGLVWQ